MNATRTTEKSARYELLERIAVGGMAELYRARMTGEEGFEKIVAIKKILPHLSGEEELVKAFIEEAKLAARLQHPNIVQIFDFGRIGGTYFIAMEYLDGRDLGRLMRAAGHRKQPIALSLALFIAGCVCEGLDYAHHLADVHGRPLNIIHRDISPQNIFITREGQVKIIDFGIAKAASRNTMTQAGVIKGKAAYMSPEQAAGETVDMRSDLFAVGLLLFELITGKPLFAGDIFKALSRLRKFRPDEVVTGDIPGPLRPVLQKALAPKPGNRYASAAHLGGDLAACAAQLDLHDGSRELSACLRALLPAEARDSTMGSASATETATMEAATLVWETTATPPVAGKAASGKKRTPATGVRGRRLRKALPAAGLAAAGLAALLLTSGIDSVRQNTPPPARATVQPAGTGNRAGAETPMQEKGGAGNDFRTLLKRAEAVMKSDPQQAETLLREAVKRNPSSSRAYHKLGVLCLNERDYEKAILYSRKAVELDPTLAKAIFNLGYAYMQTGAWNMAAQSFQRAAKLDPPFRDEALFNLAFVLDKLGKRQASIQNLREALKANPENRMARLLLKRLTS